MGNQQARYNGIHIQARGHKIKYKSEESKAKALDNLMDKSKLTDDQVRYVRRVHIPRHKEFSSTALANKFGVSVPAMCMIVKGKTYSDVV